METSALRPRIQALQAKGTASLRQAGVLRPARVASTFSGRRTCLPRNRLAASVAAADVEAPEVTSAEQTGPARGTQPAGAGTNGGARRRDGGPRRQRRLETKFKVEDLVVGQEVDGVVGSTTAFGAFVDIGLGSKDALLHISHMADGFVSDIAEHVQVGMQIKARIINVDPGSNKVGLTMRSPESEQVREERQARRAERSERFGGGEGAGDRGQAPVQARLRRAPKERKDIKFPAVGEEIQGTVEGVQNYGVFVKISDDIKAMLHGSEMATKDGREPDIRATFSVGDAVKVRVLKVDAKNRRVDVTQRSEEEIEADRTLNEKGASTARTSGMNTLQAALARAGIRKQDFEDLSKAPEENATEPSTAAAPAADTSPEAAPVDAEPAAEPGPVADAEPEVISAEEPAAESSPMAAAEPELALAQEPATEPEEEVPAPADEAKPQAAAAAGADVISPPMEGIAAPAGGNAAPVLEEPQSIDAAPVAEAAAPQPEAPTAPAIAEATPDVTEPEVAPEVPAAPEAMPEPSQSEAAPLAEEPLQASAALEEPEVELSPEAFPAAEAATSSATAGVEAAPATAEPSPEASSTETVPAASTAPEPAPAAFKVDAKAAKALRDQTGAGMMDAKKALMETGGDAAAAVEWLRKKGLSSADKKAGRVASEGVIASYIHAGSRLGVLVELNCETDFVARGEKFKELVNDMAMQIAASGEVTVISVDDVPADVRQKEFDIEMGKEDIQSKPENIRPKIVEGRVAKTFKTMALLEQAFIKDTDKDVASVIKEATAALGEKIQVRRFEKFVLGEGIEKKTNDLAKEVEAQTKAMEEAAKKAAAPADSAASPSEAAAEPAQVKIDAKAVKQLRQASGAGMMDAKKALIETGGDVDKAMEYLRKKGLASADKKAGRLASEGAIGAYIHAGSRLGVLVEVNCETDFVARGPQFKELVQDMAMQIAASAGVDIVAIEDAPQEELERERAIEMQKEDIQAKPENIRGKIVDGRVQKIFKERALLEQAFIKDTSKTVAEHIKAQVATIGENIQVRRFARFVLGEGIEKKQENFAEEIAAVTGQS